MPLDSGTVETVCRYNAYAESELHVRMPGLCYTPSGPCALQQLLAASPERSTTTSDTAELHRLEHGILLAAMFTEQLDLELISAELISRLTKGQQLSLLLRNSPATEPSKFWLHCRMMGFSFTGKVGLPPTTLLSSVALPWLHDTPVRGKHNPVMSCANRKEAATAHRPQSLNKRPGTHHDK